MRITTDNSVILFRSLPVNQNDLNSLDFVINRFLMKLLKTCGTTIVKAWLPKVHVNHKRNHPMDPWDASPSTLEIVATECIWYPQLLQLAVTFSLGTVESLQCFPDLVANFNGRRKEEQRREWVKHGWRNNGRQERDGGRKGKGIDHRWSEWKLHCISLHFTGLTYLCA